MMSRCEVSSSGKNEVATLCAPYRDKVSLITLGSTTNKTWLPPLSTSGLVSYALFGLKASLGTKVGLFSFKFA